MKEQKSKLSGGQKDALIKILRAMNATLKTKQGGRIGLVTFVYSFLRDDSRDYYYGDDKRCRAAMAQGRSFNGFRVVSGVKTDVINKKQINKGDWVKAQRKHQKRCDFCGQPFGNRAVVVDHNHTTQRVRGLACQLCNGDEGAIMNEVCKRLRESGAFKEPVYWNNQGKARFDKLFKSDAVTKEAIDELLLELFAMKARKGEDSALVKSMVEPWEFDTSYEDDEDF